ncbi:hypothetical protein H5410_001824 [Solanum commersonii]|uniref:Uncharacterized protein n=1 Tax=Solanum commersonii TaxID=4109 RepID=A0A9J6B0P2_SOLCO|nr:hypothetical protein H5410_001824 [Solanum commersonii]
MNCFFLGNTTRLRYKFRGAVALTIGRGSWDMTFERNSTNWYTSGRGKTDALKVAPPHGLKLWLKIMRYSHGETNSKSFINVKTQVLYFELWKFKLNQAHSKLLEATGLRSQADLVLLLIILKISPLLNGDDSYMR